jgi:hypothetical protein
MGHEDDRLASRPKDRWCNAASEIFVADGKDLVEEEHIRVERRGDREAQAHVHPREF